MPLEENQVRHIDNIHKKISKPSTCSFLRHAHNRQNHRKTDMLIAILHYPTGGSQGLGPQGLSLILRTPRVQNFVALASKTLALALKGIVLASSSIGLGHRTQLPDFIIKVNLQSKKSTVQIFLSAIGTCILLTVDSVLMHLILYMSVMHAMRLNSQSGTEGSPVSSLNCDRPSHLDRGRLVFGESRRCG